MKAKKKPTWTKRRHARVFAFLRPFMRFYFRLRYNFKAQKRGLKKGSYLIISNHQTTMDPFLLSLSFRFPIYFVAFDDLFNLKISSLIKYLVAPIPKSKSLNDVAAIQIPLLAKYWGLLLILAIVGALVTFFYVNFVCKRRFGEYRNEQFLAFFGMLAGTASTGMILLREIDGTYRTPASENLVYQNLPAMVFGFPLMFLATYAPTSDLASLITCIIVGVAFVVLNVVLFRNKIFKKRRTVVQSDGAEQSAESPMVGDDTNENDIE